MYRNLPDMAVIIDKYMICSEDPGGIDDAGNQNNRMPPVLNGCVRHFDPHTGRMGEVWVTYKYTIIAPRSK